MSKNTKQSEMTRRGFLKSSGVMAAVAGGAVAGCGGATAADPEVQEVLGADEVAAEKEPEEKKRLIKRYRTLGRTGFEVSDISMGCGEIAEANVVRYAYDQGLNLFDVAETYSNGDSERKLGKAMPHLDRSKIFLVTKLHMAPEDNEQTVLDRFAKCQERLNTPYVDALYMHSVGDPKNVKNPGFHLAIKRLKSEGRVKHAGISCHGPHGEGASMSEVLLAAVEDGRFDVMLLVHNFIKFEEGERVLAACKEKNIGTTCMKANAGQLEIDPFDPENPSEDYEKWIQAWVERRKITREEAIKGIQERLKQTQEEMDKNRPLVDAFRAKYGVNAQEEIDKASVSWVLNNPDMHTVCVSMPTFDKIDQYLPISGLELTARQETLLHDYKLAFGSSYCRHGCNECASVCPHGVPVSTVMRYSYYFKHQGRQKLAMQKYRQLKGLDGSLCTDCGAPCKRSCPYGVQVQASLIKAHSMLSFA